MLIDCLPSLLQTAHSIITNNQQLFTKIEARKGKQVITRYEYTLNTNSSTSKRQKPQHDNNHSHSYLLQISDHKSIANTDDIISAWTYNGEPLMKEKIAFDNFIDRTLISFDDLVRLNIEYGMLLEKYSRLLTDATECRTAMKIVISNMEVLQEAICDIHDQLIDEADSNETNDAMSLFVNKISKILGARFSNCMRIGNQITNQGGICEVNDCTRFTCKHALSDHTGVIYALQPYVLNDMQYIASGSGDQTIKLWNLSKKTVVATLKGHTNHVFRLALYSHNGVQMLASGGLDHTIKLWNLSNHKNVKTLSGHNDFVLALATYDKDDKTILISGSLDNTIKLWDLNTHSMLTTLQGHENGVRVLIVYNHDNKPYFASGSSNECIKIWSLDDYTVIRTLNRSAGTIRSLMVVNYDGRDILASGNYDGKIKLWSIGDYKRIETINVHLNPTYSLDMVRCNGKVCLVSGSWDKTIKIWDLKGKTVMATLKNDSDINTIVVFRNEDETCLASGDGKGNLKLWMEVN